MRHSYEQQYLDILDELIRNGTPKGNRTGTGTNALFFRSIRHDMSLGFPAITTKKLAFKTMAVELEGFINGVTSKKWFQDRGCHIWDGWANPQKAPYGIDEASQKAMREEDDLGPCIYGASWRGFRDPTIPCLFQTSTSSVVVGLTTEPNVGVDQLKSVVDTLKTNPNDRRMVVAAWNPLGLKHTALPPCHMGFQVIVIEGKLNLHFNMRSCDWMLGNPFNVASYALLLHLLAKETGLEEGDLVGTFTDVHLYNNHTQQAQVQLARKVKELPTIETENFTSIFDWKHTDSKLIGYEHHPAIKAPVAI